MKTIFADTSALYAVLDRDDENHAEAVRRLSEMSVARAALVTSNYVVVETCALVQRRIGQAALRTFREVVQGSLQVHWVTEREHELGMAAVLAASRRKLSLVDCVSFTIMRELGLKAAFAFDQHFEEEGFGWGL